MSTYQEERKKEVKLQRFIRAEEIKEFEATSTGGQHWRLALLQLAISQGKVEQLPLFPIIIAGSE